MMTSLNLGVFSTALLFCFATKSYGAECRNPPQIEALKTVQDLVTGQEQVAAKLNKILFGNHPQKLSSTGQDLLFIEEIGFNEDSFVIEWKDRTWDDPRYKDASWRRRAIFDKIIAAAASRDATELFKFRIDGDHNMLHTAYIKGAKVFLKSQKIVGVFSERVEEPVFDQQISSSANIYKAIAQLAE